MPPSGPRRLPTRPMPADRTTRVRRSWFRSKKLWRRLAQVAIVGVVLASLSVIGVVAWASQSLPDPNNLTFRVVAESTKILARDGKTVLYEIHGDQKRTVIELDDISPHLVRAVISIEDKDFYNHSGISIRGVIRSLWVDLLRGSKAQGGSTMTQQMVKNAILTREKSVSRKIKEVILSYQIERRYTKDQILKLYFNEIPWGSTAYGAEAAAETYFGVQAKDLSIAQSATLAAMIQSPSYYSPRGNNTDELLVRQKLVLDRMVEQGYITGEEAEAAKKVDVLAQVPAFRDRIVAPHFVFYVRDLLVQKYGELEVEQGGLRVITTLDEKLQTYAEEEVRAGAKKNDARGADNAALVSLDPKTGQILTMVGSRDFFDQKRSGNFNVITGLRNPGSSFKPIVYLSAFLKGYSPDTLLFDLKTNFGPDGSGKNYSPNNYDFRQSGPLKMRQTLAGSLNIPAVKTLYLAGIPSTIELASSLGYSTLAGKNFGLALAIGGGAVEPLEHASAFATLANDGKRNPVTALLRVEDKSGKVLEQFEKKEKQVVDKNAVRVLNEVLSDNSARAFVFGTRNPLTLSGRSVAAKTGTTNDFKDGWTVGYTPQLVTVVWVGNNNNTAMKNGSDGVIVAAPIWNAFMKRALDKKPVETFARSTKIEQSKPVLQGKLPEAQKVAVDSETKKKIPDSCLASWPAKYVAHVNVNEVHDILHYVVKDQPNGAAPKDPKSDAMYLRWEAPVQEWAKKNGYVATMPAEESCSLRIVASEQTLSILTPADGSLLTNSSISFTSQLSGFSEEVTVTYTLDGVVVGSSVVAPYEVIVSVETAGIHTLVATATTVSGLTATATISFTTAVAP